MITIETRRQLKECDQNEFVLVKTEGKLYRCIDGEWIVKLHFTISDLSKMLNIPHKRLGVWVSRLQIRPYKMRRKQIRFKLHDVKRIIELKNQSKYKNK